MAGGRPTEYTPELLEKAEEYLNKLKNDERVNDINAVFTPPSVAHLAVELGVSRKSLYNWAEQHEEFLHILEQILAIQEDMLLDRGLIGQYNSTIAKLMLTKHGYSDKTETDVTSGGKIIPIYGGLSGHNSNKEDIQTEEED